MRFMRAAFGLGLAIVLSSAGCVVQGRGGGGLFSGPAAQPAETEYRCEACGRHETATGGAPTCHDQAMQPVEGTAAAGASSDSRGGW